MRTGVVRTISKERLRVILIEEGHTTQTTKGWKHSPDPEFSTKAARLRRLYTAAESGSLDGVLVCFDEHGPVTPIPKAGRSWWPQAATEAHPGQLPQAPRGGPVLRRLRRGGRPALRSLVLPQGGRPRDHHLEDDPGPLPGRAHLGRPGQPVVALDHRGATLSPASSAITLVATPTYASWMNRIECHFGVMVKAVFAGSDYRDHAEIQAATAAYLRRRNAEARRDRVRASSGPAGPPPETAGRPAPSSCRLSKPIASARWRSPTEPAPISNDVSRRIARSRWPQLKDARVRFRDPYAYVEATLPDGYDQPLFRLRWTGNRQNKWAFAIWLASKDGYENSVLPSGLLVGTVEEAMDCACGLYLNDPSAWELPRQRIAPEALRRARRSLTPVDRVMSAPRPAAW